MQIGVGYLWYHYNRVLNIISRTPKIQYNTIQYNTVQYKNTNSLDVHCSMALLFVRKIVREDWRMFPYLRKQGLALSSLLPEDGNTALSPKRCLQIIKVTMVIWSFSNWINTSSSQIFIPKIFETNIKRWVSIYFKLSSFNFSNSNVIIFYLQRKTQHWFVHAWIMNTSK
jgi:hypothetical protein